jgi:hypothetical protein
MGRKIALTLQTSKSPIATEVSLQNVDACQLLHQDSSQYQP